MAEEGMIVRLHASLYESGLDARIGYFEGFILDTFFLDSRTVFLICDAHSQDLADVAVEIQQGRSLRKLAYEENVFFLDVVEILPPWRGRQLAIQMIQAMVKIALKRFAAGICLMQPMPLQYARTRHTPARSTGPP